MTSSQDPHAKEVLELEHRFWKAYQAHDGAAAAALCDEPSVIAGAQGVAKLERAAIASLIDDFDTNLESFELRDAEVRFIDKDVALVTYLVHEELSVGSKRLSVDAADASTWVRRNGQWLCALHTESLLGDPLGRDRNQTTS